MRILAITPGLTAMLLCLVVTAGCASSNVQGDGRDSAMNESTESEIIEIPAGEAYRENRTSGAEGHSTVQVQVPDGYGCTEYEKTFEATDGKTVGLAAKRIDMDESGFSLEIIVDDAGYLDWWTGGSNFEYVEKAKREHFNSSWTINVDGCDGTVLVQGAADEGGEISGDAFIFLDGATIWFSATPSDGKAPDADAYSEFFRSKEVTSLFDRLVISTG